VLKSEFPWNDLIDTGAVESVVNDCGLHDRVLLISQWVVLLTGSAGRLGFFGRLDDRFSNRFFPGGHSLYFADSFMREWWIPILADPDGPVTMSPSQPATALQGLQLVLYRNSEPLKLLTYALVIGLPLYGAAHSAYTLYSARELYRVKGEDEALLRLLRVKGMPRPYSEEPLFGNVILATGNFYTSFTDGSIGDQNAFALRRFYNSIVSKRGVFGVGWASTLDTALQWQPDGSAAVAWYGTSGVERLKKSDGATWRSSTSTLRRNTDKYDLVTRKGDISGVWSFSAQTGRLTGIRSVAGREVRIVWDKDRLAQRQPWGTLSYDESGQLTSVAFADGRKATYEIRNWLLLQSRDADDNVYKYEYDKRFNMTRIRYSDGTAAVMRYRDDRLVYFRDNKGRELAITRGSKQPHPTGGTMETLRVELVERTGRRTADYELYYTEHDATLYRQVEIVDGVRVESKYSEGLPRIIRAMGREVMMDYDEHGRLRRQEGREDIAISYDDSGRLAGWERRTKAGRVLDSAVYQYDDGGQLSKIVFGDQVYTLEWQGNRVAFRVAHTPIVIVTGEGSRLAIMIDGRHVDSRDAEAETHGVQTHVRSLLVAAGRPPGLFDLFRPCGCPPLHPQTLLPPDADKLLREVLADKSDVDENHAFARIPVWITAMIARVREVMSLDNRRTSTSNQP
jgi:YD repeat-containing protein